jgi:hypothetical protein
MAVQQDQEQEQDRLNKNKKRLTEDQPKEDFFSNFLGFIFTVRTLDMRLDPEDYLRSHARNFFERSSG